MALVQLIKPQNTTSSTYSIDARRTKCQRRHTRKEAKCQTPIEETWFLPPLCFTTFPSATLLPGLLSPLDDYRAELDAATQTPLPPDDSNDSQEVTNALPRRKLSKLRAMATRFQTNAKKLIKKIGKILNCGPPQADPDLQAAHGIKNRREFRCKQE